MTESSIIHYTVQTLLLVLTLSLPPILMAAIVGTLISFVQASSQVLSFKFGVRQFFFFLIQCHHCLPLAPNHLHQHPLLCHIIF